MRSIKSINAEIGKEYRTLYNRKVKVVEKTATGVILKVLAVSKNVEVPNDYELYYQEPLKREKEVKKVEKEKGREVKREKVTLDDVYKRLKSSKEGIHAKELAKEFGLSTQNIYMKMKKLIGKGLAVRVEPGVFKVGLFVVDEDDVV